jgi:hypothetical protein
MYAYASVPGLDVQVVVLVAVTKMAKSALAWPAPAGVVTGAAAALPA